MIKFVKKCVFFVIIVILIGFFAIAGYLTYVNANSTKAKNYLLEKYEINEKDWYAIKYTEYIYEDIADCNSLWLKKCTSEESLLYKYTFINKKKEKIIVSEDKNMNYSVEYDGTTPLVEKPIENQENPENPENQDVQNQDQSTNNLNPTS